MASNDIIDPLISAFVLKYRNQSFADGSDGGLRNRLSKSFQQIMERPLEYDNSNEIKGMITRACQRAYVLPNADLSSDIDTLAMTMMRVAQDPTPSNDLTRRIVILANAMRGSILGAINANDITIEPSQEAKVDVRQAEPFQYNANFEGMATTTPTGSMTEPPRVESYAAPSATEPTVVEAIPVQDNNIPYAVEVALAEEAHTENEISPPTTTASQQNRTIPTTMALRQRGTLPQRAVTAAATAARNFLSGRVRRLLNRTITTMQGTQNNNQSSNIPNNNNGADPGQSPAQRRSSRRQ